MFVSDVASQTGGGGEGALTLVTRKLLQSLHNTQIKTFSYMVSKNKMYFKNAENLKRVLGAMLPGF